MSGRSEQISRLRRSTRFRASYIRSKLNVLIPSQLRSLRLKGELTQQQLGDEAEMKQPRISAMEKPGALKFNLETLIRMAAAHKVGLQVRFVAFSEMLRWENGFSQDHFRVNRIDEDFAFLNPAQAYFPGTFPTAPEVSEAVSREYISNLSPGSVQQQTTFIEGGSESMPPIPIPPSATGLGRKPSVH